MKPPRRSQRSMSEAGFDGDLGSGILSSASQRQPVQRGDYTQTLADHDLLASVGSVGDAYDNALADSFLDSFKTELIADRVWRSRTQLELAVLEYIGWYNAARLHESLGDIPPLEYEQLHALRERATTRPPRSNYARRSDHVTQQNRSPSKP